MSLFSSLVFLYPSPPPIITVGNLRAFANQFQEAGLARQSRFYTLKLKLGKPIDSDYEDSMPMEWTAAGTGRFLEYPWDHESSEERWLDLWPSSDMDDKQIYRAYLSLGSLEPTVSKALTAMASKETAYEFIAPDQLSLEIGPAIQSTLETKVPICFSLLSVNLSGYGYFTWQPLSSYWNSIRCAPPVSTIMSICKSSFPVREFARLEDLREEIGDLFLNNEDYSVGDWIVSVRETG